MADSPRPFQAQVDLAALRSNYRVAERLAGPGMKMIPAVKANGYGFGAVAAAQVFAELDAFALATGSFEEALAIKAAGVSTPILMLGHCLPEGLPEVVRAGLIPTIFDMAGARALAEQSTPSVVYIKVDCGLRRLGVALEAAEAFVREVTALSGITVDGLYTHIPFHAATDGAWAKERLAAFDALVQRLADGGITVPVTQARASVDLLAGHTDSCNAVCVGHLLYGLPAAAPDIGDMTAFAPVLRSIKSRLIHVSEHANGDIQPSPYARRNATAVGVIPVGLADGMRNARDGVEMAMLVRGQRVPVLRVSLEHAVLDVGAIPEAAVGDDVVIVGADGDGHIQLAELANWHGCSEREVMMMFAGRLPISYRGANGGGA